MTSSKDRIVLLAAPHAGGSAAIFRGWQEQLPDWIQLCPLHLPGRGLKHALQPEHDWQQLIDVLVRDVAPKLVGPFAILGHSMGALVGLELAHALRLARRIEPVCLFASACPPPASRAREQDWLRCPRERFVEKLRALGGTPEAVLADTGLLDALLPTLRADFHLSDTYRARLRPPIHAPIIVFGGTDDPSTPVESLDGWSTQTDAECRVETWSGGHFFIDSQRASVIDRVVSSLEQVRGRATATVESARAMVALPSAGR